MKLRSIFRAFAGATGIVLLVGGSLAGVDAASAQAMSGHGQPHGGPAAAPAVPVSPPAGPAVRFGDLTIGSPWARATAPGAAVGGGYLQIENAGANRDRLVGASSPVAESVELHTMTMENNVMRMRELGAIDLPAGERVELRPGGLHLMFIGLKGPLQAGQTFPVSLRFERAGEVELQFAVQQMGAAPGHHR